MKTKKNDHLYRLADFLISLLVHNFFFLDQQTETKKSKSNWLILCPDMFDDIDCV